MLLYLIKPFIKKIRNGIKNDILMKQVASEIEFTAECNGTKFEGYNYVGSNSRVYESLVGIGSYVSENAYIVSTVIGKYTSIGPNFRVIIGQHPIDKVSTYPSFYSDSKVARVRFVDKSFQFEDLKFVGTSSNLCVLGNDVWIGANVAILNGIKIGDGAIVAAGAVVTHDVEPYTIVAGVPARLVKKRFDEDTISDLLDIQWWNKNYKWISEHIKCFDNPHELIREIKREREI